MKVKQVFYAHPNRQRLVIELAGARSARARAVLEASDVARLIDTLEQAYTEMRQTRMVGSAKSSMRLH